MSAQLIQQLVEAAGDSAEVCGGRVTYLDSEGKKVVLGGPQGDGNTFTMTDEGSALLTPLVVEDPVEPEAAPKGKKKAAAPAPDELTL